MPSALSNQHWRSVGIRELQYSPAGRAAPHPDHPCGCEYDDTPTACSICQWAAEPAGVQQPSLEVGQAHGLFHLPVVVFDAPPELGEPDQCGQRCVGGQVGEPELDRFRFGGGPLGQHPALGKFGSVGGPDDLAAGRIHRATKRE